MKHIGDKKKHNIASRNDQEFSSLNLNSSDMKNLDKKSLGDEEKFSLYTEKIVIKPSVKYKGLIKFGRFLVKMTAVIVVVFLSFTLLIPLIMDIFTKDTERSEITIALDNYTEESEGTLQSGISDIRVKELSHEEMEALVAETKKSLVTVNADFTVDDPLTGERSYLRSSTSGLIIYETSSEYIILSNYQQIAGAKNISVSFDGSYYVQCNLLKGNNETGIAVLTVRQNDISTSMRADISIARLGNSYLVKQGDVIIAAGKVKANTVSSACGFVTDSKGGISGVDAYYGLITTSIPKTYGDYAYFFNSFGEVIGISKLSSDSTAIKGFDLLSDIESETQQPATREYASEPLVTEKPISNTLNENNLIAFGISDLKAILQEMTNGGVIAYLGVSGMNVTNAIAKEYNLPVGAYISEIISDSPAFSAGIQTGDVVTMINETPVYSFKDLSDNIYRHKAGETIILTVRRLSRDEEYKTKLFSVTLGAK